MAQVFHRWLAKSNGKAEVSEYLVTVWVGSDACDCDDVRYDDEQMILQDGIQVNIRPVQNQVSSSDDVCFLPTVLLPHRVASFDCTIVSESADMQLICFVGFTNGVIAVIAFPLSILLGDLFGTIQCMDLGYYSISCEFAESSAVNVIAMAAHDSFQLSLSCYLLATHTSSIAYVGIIDEYLLVSSQERSELYQLSDVTRALSANTSSPSNPFRLRGEFNGVVSCSVALSTPHDVTTDSKASLECYARRKALLLSLGFDIDTEANAFCLVVGTAEGHLYGALVHKDGSISRYKYESIVEMYRICAFEQTVQSLIVANLRPLDAFADAVQANSNDRDRVDTAYGICKEEREQMDAMADCMSWTHLCVVLSNREGEDTSQYISGIGARCLNSAVISDSFCSCISTCSSRLAVVGYSCSMGLFLALSHQQLQQTALVGLCLDNIDSATALVNVISTPIISFHRSSEFQSMHFVSIVSTTNSNCRVVVAFRDRDVCLLLKLSTNYQLSAQASQQLVPLEIETETSILSLIRLFESHSMECTALTAVSSTAAHQSASQLPVVDKKQKMTYASGQSAVGDVSSIHRISARIRRVHEDLLNRQQQVQSINTEILRISSLLSCISDYLDITEYQRDLASNRTVKESNCINEFWRKYIDIEVVLRKEFISNAAQSPHQRTIADIFIWCSEKRALVVLDHGLVSITVQSLTSIATTLSSSEGSESPTNNTRVISDVVRLTFMSASVYTEQSNAPYGNCATPHANASKHKFVSKCSIVVPIEELALYNLSMQFLVQTDCCNSSHNENNRFASSNRSLAASSTDGESCIAMPMFSRLLSLDELLNVLPKSELVVSSSAVGSGSGGMLSLSMVAPSLVPRATVNANVTTDPDSSSTKLTATLQKLLKAYHRAAADTSSLPEAVRPLFLQSSATTAQPSSSSSEGNGKVKALSIRIKRSTNADADDPTTSSSSSSYIDLPYWQVTCNSPSMLVMMHATSRLQLLQQLDDSNSGIAAMDEMGDNSDKEAIPDYQYQYRYQYSLPWESQELLQQILAMERECLNLSEGYSAMGRNDDTKSSFERRKSMLWAYYVKLREIYTQI